MIDSPRNLNKFRTLLAPSRLLRLLNLYFRLDPRTGIDSKDVTSALRFMESSGLFPRGAHPMMYPEHYKSGFLHALCLRTKPAIVIETGVASGFSSMGILSAMSRLNAGRLYSIDSPNATYVTDLGDAWSDSIIGKEVGWRVPASLRRRWTLAIGTSRELLHDLVASLPTIDIFYHDSEHSYENVQFELREVWPQMSSNGILLADNTNWTRAFADFCRQNELVSIPVFPYVRMGVGRAWLQKSLGQDFSGLGHHSGPRPE